MRYAFVRAIAAAAVSLSGAMVYADSGPDSHVAPGNNAVVEQPRAFGYVVGDVLVQRVLLEVDGHGFEPAALPRSERIDAWLERRPAQIKSAADGRRWLTVEYQIINAPQMLRLIRIPAWQLTPKSGGPALRIGEWPISVSALTPQSTYERGDLQPLRPDRPAPSIATQPIQRRIAIWGGALIFTLIVWAAYVLWRNWRAGQSQPFARALREMRSVDETAPQAWQALHRAFDRTAGRVMQRATLPVLFERAPHLKSLHPRIEQFFEQSAERFFGNGQPMNFISVHALCVELRRIEKRHEQ